MSAASCCSACAPRTSSKNAATCQRGAAPSPRRRLGGGELRFGLRPEDIVEKRGDLPAGRAAFDAQLDVVEPMGMETMVYFLIDGTEVCGRVDPAVAGKPGEMMPLVADLNHMHLIDLQTDAVL